MCYTITDSFKQRVSRQNMSFELFKKLVDECAEHNAFSVRLSFRGEPFLNPRIYDMIKYAKDKGIKEVSTLTNMVPITPEKFEKLVDYGLDWLTVSFDGYSKDVYESIRGPAKFEEAVEKIRIFSEIKRRKNSKKPVIKMQSIWPAIKDNPQAFIDLFKPWVDQVASNPLIDCLKKDTEIEYEPNFTCPVLWQRLSIGSDGIVMLCINDERNQHIIGDVNKQTIHEVWHGEPMRNAREAHLKHRGVEEITPCKQCYLPRKTQSDVEIINGKKFVVENYTMRPQEIGK